MDKGTLLISLSVMSLCLVHGVGAVAKLRLQDFQHDGAQYVLRFSEKVGKSREIPARHDLETHIRAYLDAAGIGAENKDRPLFRWTQGKTKRLTGNPLTTKDVCRWSSVG